jgi:lysophospholipase L1-like esterase
MREFVFQDGEKVVFIGDSITDCGRRGEHAPYGWGYVRFAIDLITARYPERKITYFNEGIGGNTVLDLHNRWETDVIAHNPDWVSVKIGINDLHRTLRGNGNPVPPERYERLYRECLNMTKERTGAKLILIDPFYISTDVDSGSFETQVLKLLAEYLDIVKRLADEFEAIHIKTHEVFQRHLRYRPRDHFCPEPVHPNPSGHMIIALSLLEALGF